MPAMMGESSCHYFMPGSHDTTAVAVSDYSTSPFDQCRYYGKLSSIAQHENIQN